MKRLRYRFIIIGMCILLLQVMSEAAGTGMMTAKAEPTEYQTMDTQQNTQGKQEEDEQPKSWIVKWKGSVQDQGLLQDTEVLSKQEALNVYVVRLKQGIEPMDWMARARQSADVEYVQPNNPVTVLKAPNDTNYESQKYLRQIHADSAWEQVTGNTKLTIGVVDTGVDLKHSDLQDNLVDGVNLIKPSQLPQDDNGHGTSVAGVIGAVGNNRLGVSGILWNARVMPIKALDSSGSGDEDKLGEGIVYAIEHEVKIVVLSVGLYRYSTYMQQIVQYAESKGVLLIAATGNDAADLAGKVAVKYPAAYPEVIAVGGTADLKTAEPRSNYGPEVDVVAPWKVYTTALGGGYVSDEGTSMATPQVAAVAAMIWSKYPDMKPYQIRNLIRQSAQDLGTMGWDAKTGYGLLRADRALTMKPKEDIYEDNGSREIAKAFPIDTSMSAVLQGEDEDWFYVNAPYDGTLTLQTQLIQGGTPLQLIYYTATKAGGTKVASLTNAKTQIPVKKGKNMLQFKLTNMKSKTPVTYKLSSRFTIYSDPYEHNNKQYQAFTLPSRSQEVTGTFHQDGDEDWFVFRVTGQGTLRIKLDSDSARIDPAMEISGAGMEKLTIDSFSEDSSDSESITMMDIKPGQYYMRVYNAISPKASAVAAEYKLSIQYVTQYTDPNEPNDKSYQAVTAMSDTDYMGVFGSNTDVDWFEYRVDQKSYVELSVRGIPSNRVVTMNVYDRKQKALFKMSNSLGNTSLKSARIMEPGTYLVRLSTNQMFNGQYYQFKMHAETLVAGFRDIKGHWAVPAITALTERRWIGGYEGYRFEPDRGITRAEAVSILSKAYKFKAANAVQYSDVNVKHWAYADIAKAAGAGIVHGYQNGTFAPNRFVTRAEMAVMIGNAMKEKPRASIRGPFTDVSVNHWAAPMLSQMKSRGYLKGYSNGSFKPDVSASRAEFTAMLYEILVK